MKHEGRFFRITFEVDKKGYSWIIADKKTDNLIYKSEVFDKDSDCREHFRKLAIDICNLHNQIDGKPFEFTKK